ncbi:MAG: aminotransferase DegT [Gammaproteobacteria bacterium]|nr:aminotransferase DegT [Gammaproteobacteria bacterium]
MKFIDLKKQYNQLKSPINNAINRVLEHGQYIMGPEVNILEEKLSKYTNMKYCISCSSGTDALLMSLMSLDVGPGDAIFTSPFTFIATAEVIQLLGATPVFVDICEDTFNLNPQQLDICIKECLNKKQLNPKIILPVDIFGLPANYIDIKKISNKYEVPIIEDAAQSFGSEIAGQKAGSFGDIATTSFFPAKPLGCYGDGGAIFTNKKFIYEKLVSIRNHGMGDDKYNNVRIGINGRLDTIQAAILLEKLKIFPKEIENREIVSKTYIKNLDSYFITQYIPQNYKSSWAQFALLAKTPNDRNILQKHLNSFNIPTAIYYPKSLHLQDAFSHLKYKNGDFPVSEKISKIIFSIPMHPNLDIIEIKKICNILNLEVKKLNN